MQPLVLAYSQDNGCLRLQPFLKPAVDVAPIKDRLVIFFSDRSF